MLFQAHLFKILAPQHFAARPGSRLINSDLCALFFGGTASSGHGLAQAADGCFSRGAERIRLKRGEQQRHHPLQQARITKIDMKSLIEQAKLRRITHQHRAQGPVKIIAAIDSCTANCSHRVQHPAGADWQTGIAQGPAKHQDIVGEAARVSLSAFISSAHAAA